MKNSWPANIEKRKRPFRAPLYRVMYRGACVYETSDCFTARRQRDRINFPFGDAESESAEPLTRVAENMKGFYEAIQSICREYKQK